MISDKIIRVDLKFSKEIDEIIKRRVKLGKENLKSINGSRRLTAAIRRHPLFKDIKEDIIMSDLEEDRRRKK